MYSTLVFGQPFKDLNPLRVLEIQCQGALVAVQVLKIEPVSISTHAIASAPARHFDFDRLSTPIDQLPHTRWASTGACQVKNLHTG